MNRHYKSIMWGRIPQRARMVMLTVLLGAVALTLAAPVQVGAGASIPPLGTAASFGVLAGSAVTNTGPTNVRGDIGVSPSTALSGFPPGTLSGTIHAGDVVADKAQNAATIAYDNAGGRACDFVLTGQDLGGLTLTPGVYCFASSAQLTGQLTLDGKGSAGSVFIFQVGSTLTTASNSGVSVVNGAQSCRIFWQVGSSATLGTNTSFKGNILALTSITLNTGATTNTGLYALNGAVTLDSNAIQACASAPAPTNTATATSTDTSTATPTNTATDTATSTATATETSTALPSATNTLVPVATDTMVVPSVTNTPANSVTATKTPMPRPTNEPTKQPTMAPTNTQEPRATATPTNRAVPTNAAVSTNAPNNTVVPATATSIVTLSATSTALSSDTATNTSVATNTPSDTVTGTQTAIATQTATSTATNTITLSSATVTLTSTPQSTQTTSAPSATATTTLPGNTPTEVLATLTETATPQAVTSTETSTVAPQSTPEATETVLIPSPPVRLPPTGGGLPWFGPFSLIFGALLLAMGLGIRRLLRVSGVSSQS